MGKGKLLRSQSMYKSLDSTPSSMISIWDSGIEYGQYSYGTSMYNTNFSDEKDKNLNLPPKSPDVKSIQKTKPPKWSEFTRSTTFHGVRYLFDNSRPIALRRILWFICVTSAIVLFGVQVIDRARAYFHYDTNTNVEVVYVDKVEFPSITICNQNNFRITEVEERNLYCYIDNIFSADSSVLAKQASQTCEYFPKDVNLTEFVLSVAHQKHDFIDSCTWKGEICNITSAFQTAVTDFGVCYTFNAKEKLTLSHTGSGFALSLVLNIEQYQYMKGPQDEAGIKVLLHDYSEVPLVKDLGFAIAPGTHTLVAVQKQVVQALEKPYGTCVRNSPTRSECLSKCRTEFILSQCGCRDVGYANINNSSVCDMNDAYTCVRNTMEQFTKDDQVCVCHIPCDRTTFQPELSYAHLSKLNVNKISLNDAGKREKVQKTFEYAREVGQRVNADIASKDANLVGAVLNASVGYAHDLEHSRYVLADKNYLSSHLELVNVVYEAYPIFLEDFVLLDKIYVAKAKVMSWSFPQYAFYDNLASEFSKIVELRDTTSILKMTVNDCVEEELNGGNHRPTGSTNYYDCKDVDAYTYLYYKRNRINNIVKFIKWSLPSVMNVKDDYKQLMAYIYGDSVINYFNQAEYHLCLDILDGVKYEWVPIIEEMQKTCELYLNATSWIEKLPLIDDMIDYENMTNSESLSLMGKDYKTCNWYLIPGGTSLEDRAHALFLAHADSAKTSYYDARGIIQQLINQGIKMSNDFGETSSTLFLPFRRFQTGNISKTDLYQHIKSNEFQVGTEDLRLDNERYMTDYRQFLSKVSDIENNLLLTFNYSFSFVVPVLNDTVISKLAFINFVEDHQHLNKDIQQYLKTIKIKKAESLRGLVNELYGKYRRMIQDVHSKILQSFQELTVSLNILQADLQTFVQGNEMGEAFFMENFIKMDIFYKELSYEKIKQQVAFELLSLVSEIGGFLGLLLGASVLTVCELIDFLVISGIHRCKSKSFIKRPEKYIQDNFRI